MTDPPCARPHTLSHDSRGTGWSRRVLFECIVAVHWMWCGHISAHREHNLVFGCARLMCVRHVGWIGWELHGVCLHHCQSWSILVNLGLCLVSAQSMASRQHWSVPLQLEHGSIARAHWAFGAAAVWRHHQVPRVWDSLTVRTWQCDLLVLCGGSRFRLTGVLVCAFSACSGLQPMALWHVV